MKPVFLGIFLLIAPLIITGCGDDEEQQERPAQVVKLVEASQQEIYPGRRFVGRVDARSTVDYAFQVGGRITEFPAIQGAVIPQGELIAQLDQTDYVLQVRASEAEYEQARRNLNRQRSLRAQGAVSQAALDGAIAEAERAETQLDSARQELTYTTLNAPFDALIARRLVENYTTVPPNTEVVRIQDVSELRVRFNVPQAMMQHLENGRHFSAEAEIATLPGQRIPLEYREHITEPDEVAQTFEVEFAPVGNGIIALPGTTATVYIQPEAQIDSPLITLPSSALDNDAEGEFQVWVFDPDEGVVNPQRVSVGEMVDDRVMITAGLEAGTRVVATGAHLLRDGMQVKPLDAAL
ncbi:efflux RND transporter periplasmic adaptor subunit [Vreelandella populi]|uniref:Efflux RND transporter periplasmic adaptor subunit n=1 Tax=Vreelandella populi TaxID=2498858 RepID=A0A433LH87_9GAMM|nr:efflux RND transporter periplasmic adaptor subunit [Halomonas populi]RUR40880.1 efflux RND transporter periplasmic adaptor subunit [Halomonas populi]RUR49388.1 efflux RND transporter periplasmic adaptor subunit [Halomonas populi]RUR55872.1 efflux RND transporter periplasmic adaptor subunit [Halomonas populi]